MGVYIDMEMPENCFDCPFMYGRKYCLLNSKIEFNDPEYSELKNRYKGCPLIEVPEPHGRLIDADELDIYQRAEAAHAEYQEDEDNEYLEGVADGLCEAAKQLSFARTIIPESWEE